jgi:hypothetical protein
MTKRIGLKDIEYLEKKLKEEREQGLDTTKTEKQLALIEEMKKDFKKYMDENFEKVKISGAE